MLLSEWPITGKGESCSLSPQRSSEVTTTVDQAKVGQRIRVDAVVWLSIVMPGLRNFGRVWMGQCNAELCRRNVSSPFAAFCSRSAGHFKNGVHGDAATGSVNGRRGVCRVRILRSACSHANIDVICLDNFVTGSPDNVATFKGAMVFG